MSSVAGGRPTPAGWLLVAYGIGPDGLCDVFDAMAAERPVFEVELVPDLVIHGLRNADGAGLGERLEAGRDVDAVTKDIVAIDNDVAQVDADPKLKTALRGDRLVDLCLPPAAFRWRS